MHKELITNLGGPSRVAGLIATLGVRVTPRQVVMWSAREVSWRYRPVVAEVARQLDVELPQRFLGYDLGRKI